MTMQRPRVLALSTALATALVFAAGCKKDEPAASPPPSSGDTAKPRAAGDPDRPALPAAPGGGGGAPADDWRGRRGAPIDKNGDGVISDEERAAALHDRAEMMRKRLDADGDGKLTPAELEAARGRMRFDDLGEVDSNHDGDISADELTAALKARVERRRAARAGSGSADTQ